MRRRGSKGQFIPGLVSLAILCLFVPGAGKVDGAEDFVVVEEAVNIPERGKVAAYCILASGHRFSFIPPLHWRMESNRSEKSMTFTRRALDTAIRIRLLPEEAGAKENEDERWQQLVQARYPDAEVIRRFICHTGTRPGMGFDLRQDWGRNLKLDSRVTFVKYEQGVVEIGQTSLSGKTEPAYEDFGMMLTSLRISKQTLTK